MDSDRVFPCRIRKNRSASSPFYAGWRIRAVVAMLALWACEAKGTYFSTPEAATNMGVYAWPADSTLGVKVTKTSGGSWLSYDFHRSGSYSNLDIVVTANTGANARTGEFTVQRVGGLTTEEPTHIPVAQVGTLGTFTCTVSLNPWFAGAGGTTSVTATFGSPMPPIETPSYPGHSFVGYFSSTGGKGTQYYDANGTSCREWKGYSNITLYASYKANQYDVYLDDCGGAGGTELVTATYGKALPPVQIPKRDGYSFGGYFTEPGGGGLAYYGTNGICNRTWSSTEDQTLYAKWIGNTYDVELDANGGAWGTPSVEMTYGSALPDIVPPTREGWVFAGYFDGEGGTGTQYYDAEGKGVRTWDKLASGTLCAKWTSGTALSLPFASEGGTQVLEFPGLPGAFSCNEGWLNGMAQVAVSDGDYKTLFHVTCDRNGGAARSGTVSLSVGGVVYTIAVEQAGTAFAMTGWTAESDGTFSFRFPAERETLYQLQRGQTLDGNWLPDGPVVYPLEDGEQFLTVTPPNNWSSGFYRVMRVDQAGSRICSSNPPSSVFKTP